jgi:CRP/FNR family transcriptional regulator, transcriptional activator FtrB
MREEEIAALRGLRLFAAVGEATFADLIAAGYLQFFPPGVTLIHERDPADFLHIVVEGTVELYAGHDGHETTMEFYRPVSAFILAAVLLDQVYLQSARTLTRARILMIPAARVRGWMAMDAAFMSSIVGELARGYRLMVKALKNQKLRTGAERLANWLINAEAAQGTPGRVAIDIEKRVLASRLGMTPENLSRALNTLAAHGVEVKGPRIDIADAAALRAFAKPDPLIDGPE